jgi:hypothetical protein|tara:strand:- start:240 stop:758 length:519 start_codon:yes stop_codon:yes gene_type:complete
MVKEIVNVYHETTEFTCMFPNLVETEKFQEQDTGMYSITMCFDKGDEGVKEALDENIEEAKNNDEKVANAKEPYIPIKDGDEMGKEWSAGRWVLKAKTKFKPKIVSRVGGELNPESVHNGSICRAHIVFRPFIAGTNKGVTCSLKDLQFISEGDGVGGGVPTFSPLDDDVPF